MAPKKKADGEEREAKKVTPKQQELLMQLLLERPRLGKGKLDRTFTNLDKKKQWLEVIDLIHAAGLGPMKTYEKWTKEFTSDSVELNTQFDLLVGAKIIPPAAVGATLDEWEDHSVFIEHDVTVSELDHHGKTTKANLPDEVEDQSHNPTEAPDKTKRRKRVHATEATLEDTVSIATKYAKEQEKATQSLQSLATSGVALVKILERQIEVSEFCAAAVERLASAAERRAAAAEQKNAIQAAILEKFGMLVESLIKK